MRPKHLPSLAAAALLAGLSAACAGDSGTTPTPQPVAGVAVVTLAGAREDDAAVVLEVGAGVTRVSAAGSAVVGAGPQGAGGKRRVIVLGPLTGDLVRLEVSSVRELPEVLVREVATRDGTLRADPSGYGARLQVQ